MILHLFQEIPYKRVPLPQGTLGEVWGSVLERADSMETGSELCLVVDHDLVPVDYGWREAPNADEKARVEAALPQQATNADFTLPKATYQFVQLDFLPDEGTITSVLGPYAASGDKGPCRIRLVKENALVLAVQLFRLP